MTKPLETLAPLLDRLHRAADAGDPALISRIMDVSRAEGRPLDDADPRFAAMLAEAYIPVSRDVGRLLYILARAHGSRTIVEFGTSFGISTIYLAAAARENGGRVVTSEQNPGKGAAGRASTSRKPACPTSSSCAWATRAKPCAIFPARSISSSRRLEEPVPAALRPPRAEAPSGRARHRRRSRHRPRGARAVPSRGCAAPATRPSS